MNRISNTASSARFWVRMAQNCGASRIGTKVMNSLIRSARLTLNRPISSASAFFSGFLVWERRVAVLYVERVVSNSQKAGGG